MQNMQKIIDIMDKAINDLNEIKNNMTTDIKYVVVKLDNSGRGLETIERFEFDNVLDAIKKHRAVRGNYSDSTYWDLVIEYT